MAAYDEIYVGCIQRAQGKVFFHIREELPGADEKWFRKIHEKRYTQTA